MIKKVVVLVSVILVALVAAWYWSLARDSAPTLKHSVQTAQTSSETKEDPISEAQSTITDTVKGGTPKIFFPETSYDFGAVVQGSKASHKFVVRNVGDAPLQLIDAKAS